VSLNLRQIVNPITNTVNSNIIVSLQTSAGYIIGSGQRQQALYNPPITGIGQMQALDGSDLRQIEDMNLQGTLKALYMYGNLAAVMRTDSKGGDLVTIKSGHNRTVSIPVTASQTGVISIPHGLGLIPDQVKVLATNAGALWQPVAADATNVYVQASDVGVTGVITVISNGVPQNRNVPQLMAGVWLVEKVLEGWSDWTKVCIRKQ
jgi:hypothetical protein